MSASRNRPSQEESAFPSIVAKEFFQILHDEEKPIRIGRAGIKGEMFIEGFGLVILGDDEQGADTGNVRSLRRAKQGILEEAFSNPAPLLAAVDGKPPQNHDRHQVAGKPLSDSCWYGSVCSTADGKAVVANNDIATRSHVGLGTVGLLASESKFFQKTVKFFVATIKGRRIMRSAQLFDRRERGRDTTVHSNTLGSRNSASRRGFGFVGASSAA